MDKLIVTGSCGFIGYNFIKSNNKNFEIVGIDSLNNAYDKRMKELRLKSLQNIQNFSFHQADLSNKVDMNNLMHVFSGATTVVHLAARAGVRQSFLDPKSYIEDNTIATATLSNIVKNNSINKLIVASTSSIYGDTGSKLAEEYKDELNEPPSIYAATKSFGETLAKNILEDEETIVQFPRFFTVYGPYGRPDMSILRFVHWVFNNDDVIVYGNGEQKRSFTFISDIVNGLNRLLDYNKSGTFNLGSNQTWSLNEIINLIEKKLNSKAKIVYKDRAMKDVDIVLPSLERSNKLLDWEPKISIKDGLDLTIEWYLKYQEELSEIGFKYKYEE